MFIVHIVTIGDREGKSEFILFGQDFDKINESLRA
jgi:hypothetical protein